MYVTIRNYEGNSELADILAQNEGAIREIITSIDGFRAYYLVRSDGGTASVSVFDTKEGADASTKAASDWVRENAGGSASAPSVTSGETVFSF